MFVHLKQSGELLAAQAQEGDLWTPNGVRVSSEKIDAAFRTKDQLGIDGLLVVSGAGNIIRGKKLEAQRIAKGYEDLLGRLATVQNTIVLATALEERKVPVRVFIADNMRILDPGVAPGFLEQYDIGAVQEAYEAERVVLVAGGTGEDYKTTDNSVMEYARRQSEATPDGMIVVLKGTKHDGVYDNDPEQFADAKRYKQISAHTMIEDHERFSVVDRASLQQIIDSGISMRIYADGQHDFQTAIGCEDGAVGTLVVPDEVPPVFAN